MGEQVPYVDPFEGAKFETNPEPRCACVLLLDTSGSMAGAPIEALNAGVKLFRDELAGDSVASKRMEIAIVTFGGRVSTVCGFTTADQFQAPTLAANGETPMGEAIEAALDMIEAEKQKYKANGIAFYRPLAFMITDGQPTDGERWKSAAQRVREGEQKHKVAFFCVAVRDANMETLAEIASPQRPPLKLDGLKFREFFLWLSRSVSGVSRSAPDDHVKLEDPRIAGWTSI